MGDGLAAGGFLLATAALTAALLLACAIGLAIVRRERGEQRRLAAANGWIDRGFGEFGGTHAGVPWSCAPRQDDDSGRAWTEFVASGAVLLSDAVCTEFDTQNPPAWRDDLTAALWQQALGSSTSLRLAIAPHSLMLLREDGVRRATPQQVGALVMLGQACLDRWIARTV